MWPKNKIPNLIICICIILKMLQARVTMKSLLTGCQRLFTDNARRAHLRAFIGARGSRCWAVRWPLVAVMALSFPCWDRGRGRCWELHGSPRSPTSGRFLRKEAVAVSVSGPWQ